jgi:hypothetical protein
MKKAVIFIMLMLGVHLAGASYISMQTSAEIQGSNVLVTVSNLGDEPAKDVQISAELNSQKRTGSINPILGVNQNVSEIFEFDTAGMNGIYPLVINIEYSDINSYQFSSIAVNLFTAGENRRSELSGKMDAVELKEESDLRLVLKNSGAEKTVNLRIVAPKELTVENPQGTLNLAPGVQGALDIKLKRFSALPGSTYVIYALAEYDEDNAHYTSITSAVVSVIENKPFKIPLWLYAIALILLISVVTYYQFSKKK